MVKLLFVINQKKNLTQRDIAKEMEVSLGKVNELIKTCIQNNYLIKLERGYEITEDGFEFLRNEMEKLRLEKIKLNDNECVVNTAVILAAGENKDFNIPVSKLEIEGKSIIRRNIELLKEEGIRKFYIVIGFNGDEIKKEFSDDLSVIFIENKKFRWTGNMESLSLVKEYISEDFLLLEGDILIESIGFRNILNSKFRDCILVTNESGSGDEGFVQIKNDCLFKLGKDIHQFNKIDGEMIGISKISYKLFKMMCDEYKENINPYLNYEYMLLDVSRNYIVNCVKVDDLAWGEVDNKEQYEKLNNYIYPKIRRKEIKFKKDYISNVLKECLDLDKCIVSNVIRIGGMTNKNYKVNFNDNTVILRIPGIGTDKMINRKNEIRNCTLIKNKNIDSDILYINEETGIKISKCIEGAETLTGRSAKKEENIRLVTDILKKLHLSNIEMSNEFNPFCEIKKYEEIISEINGKYYLGYENIRNEVLRLEEYMNESGARKVPSHNDTLPDNFIKDKFGKLYLIDWEYSGLNDNMWDIAAHSLEAEFDDQDDELLLKYYLNGEIDEDSRKRFLMNKILQDILWSLWTIIKEHEGENFGTYGIDRYNRGVRNLKRLKEII
ncbi:phosphotransferase [Clostridium thermobutyricum]|uniref:phosphotransferase n=1 Tax=Clostridium thermobutyricum TaxID=29372 RepID=UPI0029422CA3|nr:phosphotransferase [Clostridium thermobutyricum]